MKLKIAELNKKLAEIATYEDNINNQLQSSIVSEVASDFKEKFTKSPDMQNQALAAAIESLSGTPSKNDPVMNFFTKTLAEIDLSGKAKANATGTVSEKLAFLQETAEGEFKKNFYVTKEEVAEVKAAGSDESKLSAVMAKIYMKSGFHMPSMYGSADLASTGEALTDSFISEANAAKNKLEGEVKKATYSGFSASF